MEKKKSCKNCNKKYKAVPANKLFCSAYCKMVHKNKQINDNWLKRKPRKAKNIIERSSEDHIREVFQ